MLSHFLSEGEIETELPYIFLKSLSYKDITVDLVPRQILKKRKILNDNLNVQVLDIKYLNL